eukprot:363357-Chlamydomonas_euryale.AAC.2
MCPHLTLLPPNSSTSLLPPNSSTSLLPTNSSTFLLPTNSSTFLLPQNFSTFLLSTNSSTSLLPQILYYPPAPEFLYFPLAPEFLYFPPAPKFIYFLPANKFLYFPCRYFHAVIWLIHTRPYSSPSPAGLPPLLTPHLHTSLITLDPAIRHNLACRPSIRQVLQVSRGYLQPVFNPQSIVLSRQSSALCPRSVLSTQSSILSPQSSALSPQCPRALRAASTFQMQRLRSSVPEAASRSQAMSHRQCLKATSQRQRRSLCPIKHPHLK